MQEEVILPSGRIATKAEYTHMPIEEYNENPYIQCLPILIDKQTMIEKLMAKPTYDEEERQMNSLFRLHFTQRLYNFFQPLPIHIEIWRMVNFLLVQSYLSRNPFNKDYKRYMHETGKKIIQKNYDLAHFPPFRTTASCGTLIGLSGMGKTTSFQRILHNIPQVIVHNEYKGQHFSQIQLTWLKLEAPHNSSLKALCLQFFMKIDEVLGTNNFKKYVSRNLSVDAMLPLMGQVAQNIGLGLLVIDEIQHLRNRGADQMMNFFVTLINSFGVSIALIGTPAAYDIFANELRIARRLTGNGEIIYNNMECDEQFEFFLESMWEYQWTYHHTPLTKEFVQVFYEETQGILDLVIKLFVTSQQKAIMTGKEELTVSLVRKVAKERFKFMSPMLEAIQSGNPHKIAKYEDIRKIEWRKKDESKKEAGRKSNTQESGNLVSKKIAMEEEKMNIVQEKRNDCTVGFEQGDLRQLLRKAKKEGKTAYEMLLENGYIDDMTMW
ncbi:ATP-binding protein [Geobacillus stearothermophilus]|uniref:ATP-binding protein n=1 Tax=Geobacillus TaxID=129337 RepID=UPI002E1B357E|nr:ATP-binding protein [Geobacillus stearothermophilus]MED4986661.1 ATP-binding protein [Geobacillus stearothermophilus]